MSSSDQGPPNRNVTLLRDRDKISNALRDDAYSLLLYLQRGHIYDQLGYPDLAVMDVYKALLLADEILESESEFHEQAYASTASMLDGSQAPQSLQDVLVLPLKHSLYGAKQELTTCNRPLTDYVDLEELVQSVVVPRASILLAYHLATIGCLRTAYEYAQNALKTDHEFENDAQAVRQHILVLAQANAEAQYEPRDDKLDVDTLPDRGHVRREVYPWNSHEQDKLTTTALDVLNMHIAAVAPKLQVNITKLPALARDPTNDQGRTSRQLGVFAKQDLRPGEMVLRERSLLTASAMLHEPHCDACSAALPTHGPSSKQQRKMAPVACPDCYDIFFCGQECLDLALASYHASVCGADIDEIARNVPMSQAVDALYTLLLLRALAMSTTQDCHPLELQEVKYIWGDFSPLPDTMEDSQSTGQSSFESFPRTLPFDFRSQVLQPIHFLEMIDINIFEAPHDLAEIWMYNTLFAKLRGTASARVSPRDGRPEVAAVHPLWCLTNHSCDPNVTWEGSGEVAFTVKPERARWQRKGIGTIEKPAQAGGIKKGDEILSHYVDIDLDVDDRREWGAGALGGMCQCERCLWESGDAE